MMLVVWTISIEKSVVLVSCCVILLHSVFLVFISLCVILLRVPFEGFESKAGRVSATVTLSPIGFISFTLFVCFILCACFLCCALVVLDWIVISNCVWFDRWWMVILCVTVCVTSWCSEVLACVIFGVYCTWLCSCVQIFAFPKY